MRKLALAILFAITPAAAESRTEPSHQVSFQGITFTCGQKSEGSRFMYAVPAARYLPVNEPPSGEPGARSWAIVFRIICDEACSRQTANQHPAREAARRSPYARRSPGRADACAATRSEQEPGLGADKIFPAAGVHLRGRTWHVAVRTEDAAIPLYRLHDPAASFALIKVLDCVFVHGLTFVMSARRTYYRGYKLIHRSTWPLNELHFERQF